MKHALLVFLLGGALVASSGCAACQSVPCGPCGGPEACGPGPCAGPMCRPFLGCGLFGWRCRAADCEAPCDPCQTECADCPPGPGCPCRPCGPLVWLFRLFYCDLFPTCGCGERYWGEYVSNPPDCCDPCDCHGNWIGRGNGCVAGSPQHAGPDGYGNLAGRGIPAGSYAAGRNPAGSRTEVTTPGSRYTGTRYPARQYVGGVQAAEQPRTPFAGVWEGYPRTYRATQSVPRSPAPLRVLSETNQAAGPASAGQSTDQAAQPKPLATQR